jgi:hypothetical protein
LLWFAEEQVYVVGHDDVAEDVEDVFFAGFFEDVKEGIARFGSAQDGAFTGATEGKEVEVSGLVIAV